MRTSSTSEFQFVCHACGRIFVNHSAFNFFCSEDCTKSGPDPEILDTLEKYQPNSLIGEPLLSSPGLPWILPSGIFISLSQKQTISDLAVGLKKLSDYQVKNHNRCLHAIYIKSLYEELGTLEAVGKRLDLTRERIRQILKEGELKGWIPERHGKDISREKVLQHISTGLPKNIIANNLGIGKVTLQALLNKYDISSEIVKGFGIQRRKLECKEWYDKLVQHLGKHPSTSLLLHDKSVRAQYARICRTWGNFSNFRNEFGIPSIGQEGSDYIKAMRNEREIATHHILSFVQSSGSLVSINEIHTNLKNSGFSEIRDSKKTMSIVSYGYVHSILVAFIASGRLKRYGSYNNIRYGPIS